MRKTTCGWKFLVLWKDGSETWVPLRDMKEVHPIEVAEYAKSRRINKEPAFAWWLPYNLCKRDIIISEINTQIQKTTHKYGIEIPRNVRHARKLDQSNGNDFWVKAIEKEMTNVGIAFEILDESQSAPIGCKHINVVEDSVSKGNTDTVSGDNSSISRPDRICGSMAI